MPNVPPKRRHPSTRLDRVTIQNMRIFTYNFSESELTLGVYKNCLVANKHSSRTKDSARIQHTSSRAPVRVVHSVFSYLTKNVKSVLYVYTRSPQSIWIRCYFHLYFRFHFAFPRFLFQLKYIEFSLPLLS